MADQPAVPSSVQGKNVVIAKTITVQGDFVLGAAAHPYLVLTTVEGLRPRAPEGVELSTAALLSPFAKATPMVGRDREIEELCDWLGSKQRISVHGVIGDAGAGKTRLAMELCRKARAEGWDAGFVRDREITRFSNQQSLETWAWKKPTLAIIDYAAGRSRQLYDWFSQLSANDQGSPLLRVLLLERHGRVEGGWWKEAFYRGSWADEAIRGLMYSPAGPSRLLPITDLGNRLQIMDGARTLVAGQTIGPLSEESGLRVAKAEWSGQPLFLMMATIVGAEEKPMSAEALGRAGLALRVAEHEQRRIKSLCEEDQALEDVVCHLAAFTTLCQGMTLKQLEGVFETERKAMGISSVDRSAVSRKLLIALPGSKDTIAAITPDIVGEAFLATNLAIGRANAAKAALLRASELKWDQAVAVAIRAVCDLARDPACKALKAWTFALIESARDETQLLMLGRQMPQQTVVLRREALVVAERILQIGRTRESRQWIAAALSNLAKSLSELGRREEALEAAAEAAEHYRELTSKRPDAFRPYLAGALNNVGAFLSELGRREEALDAATEAAGLYRELASERPDAFRSDLAGALNNLANALSDLGRREEALEAATEAAELYRELTSKRPDEFRPDLAMSLNNLANRLSDLGRREEALRAASEAAELYRELASERPDAFRPDLAGVLNCLGSSLSDLGKREEALQAASEAAGHYRELASERPDAFRPFLAMSSDSLGVFLSDLGRLEEALQAASEAAGHFRELASERPDAFRPDLASALSNLARSLSALGRREEALQAASESVDIRRELASERPDAFRPFLANALNNLANALSDLGRREEALQAASEAAGLYQELASERPDAFRPELAMSLNNLASRLSDLGRREKALKAATEAAGHFRALTSERPDAFRPELAGALNNLASRLSDLGRYEEALEAASEAAALYRELSNKRPDAFRLNHAGALNNLGSLLSKLGRREEALQAATESVGMLEPRLLEIPKAFASWMTIFVKNYLRLAKDLNQEPDHAMLEPIVTKLNELSASESEE